MIAGCSVAAGAGSFLAVAWGTEGSVAHSVDCPVVGGTGYSVAGGAESFGCTS